MKLEQQVCSLELAKRLRELGVKQESLCSWKPDRPQVPALAETYLLSNQWELFDTPPTTQDYAAFTVAELGEMLPARLRHGKSAEYLDCFKRNNQRWHTCYITSRPVDLPLLVQEIPIMTSGDTEADARAKMLIYLLENGLTSAPQRT